MPSRRTAKARGSAAERELLHMFYAEDWGAVRAAGSGSIPLEVPDIIAGHNGRTVAVEVKYCSEDRKYLLKQELDDLLEFGRRTGAECWVGVKFTRRGWWFVRASMMKSSGKNFVLSYEDAQESALSFERLINLPKTIVTEAYSK